MRTPCVLGLGLVILAGGERAWGQGAGTPPNLRELLPQLDANGDRTLEASEIPERGRPAFERLLKLGDTNRDGKLQPDELQAMAQKVRALAPADPAERAARLKAMDKDGDGRISRDEFTAPPALFDRLDADQDGFITQEEVARLRPAAAASPARTEAPKGSAPAGAADFLLPRVRAMDTDGDGRISREEFTGRPLVFDRLDADRDGALSPSELRAGAAQLKKVQPKQVRKPAQP